MTILREFGDGIEGERIWAEFRKMRKPVLVQGTAGHRARRTTLEGLPALAVIEKPIRVKAK